MSEKNWMVTVNVSYQTPLTLAELCEICRVDPDVIIELVEFHIIDPQGHHPREWLFDLKQLRRVQTTLRLQRDLDVNLAGVAIVLDLLEEIEQLRAHVRRLENQR